MTDSVLPPAIRAEAEFAPSSGIVEVFNYGRDREGIIPLWAGEGDLPTPAFIREAAARSLEAGETYYTAQRGLPELRQAIATYTDGLYGGSWDPNRFSVTSSGMHALLMSLRLISGAGNEVIVPTPAWPNFIGAMTTLGATPVEVPMLYGQAGWNFDLDAIARAITPHTRAIVINSPSNPTGFTASYDELEGVLALARKYKLWILADEIYGRFVHDDRLTVGNNRAPSVRDVMREDDDVLFIQSFSKNWAMTGWRVGWIEAPPCIAPVIENLVQYSTSGVPVFVQRGALAAITEGEAFIQEQVARSSEGRKIICDRLAATGVVDLVPPPGAFYAYFRVDGVSDSASWRSI